MKELKEIIVKILRGDETTENLYFNPRLKDYIYKIINDHDCGSDFLINDFISGKIQDYHLKKLIYLFSLINNRTVERISVIEV